MQEKVGYAPAIITTMINMFLSAGSEPANVNQILFNGQIQVALAFVLIAFICVPTMLIVKPLHFKFTHKDHHPAAIAHSDEVFKSETSIEK